MMNCTSQAKQFITRGNAGRNLYSEALMHAIEDVPLKNAMRHELTRPLLGWDRHSIRDLVPRKDYEPKLLNHAEGIDPENESPKSNRVWLVSEDNHEGKLRMTL
jgi:hypothetical protein